MLTEFDSTQASPESNDGYTSITLAQIQDLVMQGESETLEFKETTKARKEAAHTLCAMLNHRGGCVLFGVAPRKEVKGQQVGDRTVEEVSEEIQRIEPQVLPAVEIIPMEDDRAVIAVSVKRGAARPYSYRGRAYRRVGNTTVTMLAHEYQRMLLERMHNDQRWENQPAEGWTVEDLDVTEIQRTVTEAIRRGRLADPGSRDPVALLRGLKLWEEGVLLRAAAVLFGNTDRIEFKMPQCRLRVARFRGVDRMEILDNRQFYGNAFALLAHAERFLRETVPIAARFEPNQMARRDLPLYPYLATREALANALCHRDYSIGGGSVGVAVYDDRLEITSSGMLHFGLTPEQLFNVHESLPWNPLIAHVFYRRGIIEEWGRGTIQMADAAASAGLPRPEIEDAGGCVTVRFLNRSRVPSRRDMKVLSEQQRAILDLLERSDQGLALREIHVQLELQANERRLGKDLALLKARGLATPTGRGRGARWRLRRERGLSNSG